MPALASRLPRSRNADAWFARSCGCFRAFALLPIVLSLLAPATVRGDIYKWTDERGNTVISNVQPGKTSKVSDMELLAAETRSATPSPSPPSPPAAARTEQALEARIENLERQLHAQQPQAVPQPAYSAGNYPMPVPAPQPEPGYYSGYNAGYYPAYYPGYYAPWPPSYPVIVMPARKGVHRPGFVSRPAFVGRPPVFVGRPPVFVGQSPVVVSQPAFGFSDRATFGGRSTHRARR